MPLSGVKKLVSFFEKKDGENQLTVLRRNSGCIVQDAVTMSSIEQLSDGQKIISEDRIQKEKPRTPSQQSKATGSRIRCLQEEAMVDHIKDITLESGFLLYVTHSKKMEDFPKILYTHRKKDGCNSSREQLVTEFVQEFQRRKS